MTSLGIERFSDLSQEERELIAKFMRVTNVGTLPFVSYQKIVDTLISEALASLAPCPITSGCPQCDRMRLCRGVLDRWMIKWRRP